MKKLALILCLFVLGLGSGWAAVTGTTNPAQFSDYVDWCVQYGCGAGQFATPQPFISDGGIPGLVGLAGTGQGFYNLQDGVSWGGGFPSGMGLIYNGAIYGNTPTQIAATFDVGVNGVGAWIQDNYIGVAYIATIQLFDSSYQLLGSYSMGGVGNNILFLGAISTVPIWAVQFDLVDNSGNEDFAIGSLKVNTVPEPASLLLLGSTVLGAAGVLRRRFRG